MVIDTLLHTALVSCNTAKLTSLPLPPAQELSAAGQLVACLQVLPCSLSVTTYHLFQLTECSTVFLHLSWMASKSQAQYSTLFKVTIALLVAFIVRCVINAGIVWHVCTRLLDLQLWDVRPIFFSCRHCLRLECAGMRCGVNPFCTRWMPAGVCVNSVHCSIEASLVYACAELRLRQCALVL